MPRIASKLHHKKKKAHHMVRARYDLPAKTISSISRPSSSTDEIPSAHVAQNIPDHIVVHKSDMLPSRSGKVYNESKFLYFILHVNFRVFKPEFCSSYGSKNLWDTQFGKSRGSKVKIL